MIDDLISHLKFRNIMVTGPFRSGTRLGALILANRLNKKLMFEGIFKYSNLPMLESSIFDDPFIIQAPAAFHLIPEMQKLHKDMAFVVMHRPVEEILRSQQHLYDMDGKRIARSRLWDDVKELWKLNCQTTYGTSAEAKYGMWAKWRAMGYVDNSRCFDLNYYSLEECDEWVDVDERRKEGPLWHYRRVA